LTSKVYESMGKVFSRSNFSRKQRFENFFVYVKVICQYLLGGIAVVLILFFAVMRGAKMVVVIGFDVSMSEFGLQISKPLPLGLIKFSSIVSGT
jgi:hypothetical protein